MNERTANEQGLYFTGHYESLYSNNENEKIKNIAKNLREEAKKMGLKIRIVTVKKDNGQALFASGEDWQAFQKAKDMIRLDARLLENKAMLLKEAQDNLETAKIELSNLKNDIMFAQERANKELSK